MKMQLARQSQHNDRAFDSNLTAFSSIEGPMTCFKQNEILLSSLRGLYILLWSHRLCCCALYAHCSHASTDRFLLQRVNGFHEEAFVRKYYDYLPNCDRAEFGKEGRVESEDQIDPVASVLRSWSTIFVQKVRFELALSDSPRFVSENPRDPCSSRLSAQARKLLLP